MAADLISSGIGTNPRRQASWTSSNGLTTTGTMNPYGLTQNDQSVGYMGEAPPAQSAAPTPAPTPQPAASAPTPGVPGTSQNAQIALANTDPNGAEAYYAQRQAAAPNAQGPDNPINSLFMPPAQPNYGASYNAQAASARPVSPLSSGNPLNSLISTGMGAPNPTGIPSDTSTDPAAQARQILGQYGGGHRLRPIMGGWGNRNRRTMPNGALTLQSGAINNGAPQ